MLPGVTLPMVYRLVLTIESGFIIGAVGMAISNRGAEPDRKRRKWRKFFWYFGIVHAVLLVIAAGGFWSSLLFAGLGAVALGEVISVGLRGAQRGTRLRVLGFSAAVVVVSGITISFVWTSPATLVVFAYVVVAVLDAFSQITGQILGRTPLAPRISPAKTVEGAFGGALCAVIAALVLADWAGVGGLKAMMFGLVLAASGIAGDLLSSSYKRSMGVKDYSSLLPGQGGVMDRFNSFWVAAPVLFLILT